MAKGSNVFVSERFLLKLSLKLDKKCKNSLSINELRKRSSLLIKKKQNARI